MSSPSARGDWPQLPATSSSTSRILDVDEVSLCESDEEYLARKEASASPSLQRAGAAGPHTYGGQQHSDITVQMGHVETATTTMTTPVRHAAIGGTSTPLRSFAEERMRRKLLFFFMNPIEKWQTRRRFPYKFLVQLIKLVLVSIQLCLFAHSR